MQLRGRHVQGTKHAHGELIKGKTNMRICEQAEIDIKEVMVVTFPTMTYIIYRRATLNK